MSAPESNRGRVRRILIDPLKETGFRFRRSVPDEEARVHLDRIADRVGYMSDAGLAALCRVMQTRGEGSAKVFWPAIATFSGYAEALEPRPLEEMPELLRWFASRAGPDALAARRHVAEYLYWRDRKAPPMTDGARRSVQARADAMNARAARIQERVGRGLRPLFDDGAWYARYCAMDTRVRGYIESEGCER